MAASTGRFVWFDLSTTDLDAAKAFYGAVVGWGSQSHNADYQMWNNGEKTIGGMMILAEQAKAMSAPPNWMAYVSVEDLAATVAQAQALGSQVYVPPTAIDGAGHFAVLADPQGAIFALYSSDQDGPVPDPGVGDISWVELATSDLGAAATFYDTLFGWHGSETDMGGGNMYRLYNLPGMGDRHMGGMYTLMPGMPMPPNWLCYITVADLDIAIAAVTANGGQILNGPMDVPGGDRIVQCMDPQGAAFALHWR